MTAQPAWQSALRRYWGLFVVLAAILFIGAVRVRLRDCPLERDEGEYAYAGQLMLQGIPPYELAYNMKFPGTYAAYALIMSALGQTPSGIHLGVLGVTSLMALMLYWLGRQLLDETAGAVAGTVSVFLSASPSMLGLAGHATHFAAFFATAGLCLLWQTWKNGRAWIALAAGVCFGLAVLMKQHAIFVLLWGVTVLVFTALRPQASAAKNLRLPIYAILGSVLPFGITCLLLWHAGVFGKFWFWTINYARVYVSTVSWQTAPVAAWIGVSSAAQRCGLLWLLGAVGFGLLWLERRLAGFRLPLAGFVLASFLTTCPGLYFRFHYFLLLIPALALLAGCGLSTLWQMSSLKLKTSLLRFWPAPGMALVLCFTTWQNRDVWFDFSPVETIQRLYGPEAFSVMPNIADFVRTNSSPTDTVAVLGSEPEVYFLSGRHSATGYIYMYPLVEHQAYAPTMQQEMMHEIETARPRFIVFVRMGRSWTIDEHADLSLFDWWYHSCSTNYAMVGMTEISPPDSWRYIWGAEAAHRAAVSQLNSVLVYQRKDSL